MVRVYCLPDNPDLDRTKIKVGRRDGLGYGRLQSFNRELTQFPSPVSTTAILRGSPTYIT